MEFEMPMVLIKEVQIQFRRNAGLASYDPDNSTLPNLPSSGELISQMDPSPSYLRCRGCNGRLPRGLNSFFCVFCGKNQKNDVPPEPIAFRTTSGCRWLLESLGLDGSEIVEPYVTESEIKKGQNGLKEKLSLSELLDLEIKWPVKEDKKGSHIHKTSVNLTGVDLDDYFSKSREDTFETPKDLSGDDMQNSRETITASQIDEKPNFFNDDNECGWMAEFKSASRGSTFEDSKSSNPLWSTSVDRIEEDSCEPNNNLPDNKDLNLNGSLKMDRSADNFSNGCSSSKLAPSESSLLCRGGSADVDGARGLEFESSDALQMHDLSFMLEDSLSIPPSKTT